MSDAVEVIAKEVVPTQEPVETLDSIAQKCAELEGRKEQMATAEQWYRILCDARVAEVTNAIKKAAAMARGKDDRQWIHTVGEDTYKITRYDNKLSVVITHKNVSRIGADAPKRTVLEYGRSLEARVEYGGKRRYDVEADIEIGLWSCGIIGGLGAGIGVFTSLTGNPLIVGLFSCCIGVMGGAIGAAIGAPASGVLSYYHDHLVKKYPYEHVLDLKDLSRLSPDSGSREIAALERVPQLLVEAHADWYAQDEQRFQSTLTAFEDGKAALAEPVAHTEEPRVAPISDDDIALTR